LSANIAIEAPYTIKPPTSTGFGPKRSVAAPTGNDAKVKVRNMVVPIKPTTKLFSPCSFSTRAIKGATSPTPT
jgi:hypothetical protein